MSEKKSTELWSSISLPSKFKPYTQKECKIRPLKVGEVRQIQSSIDGTSGLSIAEIIRDAVSIPVLDLTHGDFWFVLAWLRINTYRNYPLSLEWKCKNKHTNSLVIDLTKINIVELSSEYSEPVILKTENRKLSLRLPRVGDEILARKYLSEINDDGAFTQEDVDQACQALQLVTGQSLYHNLEALKEIEADPDGPEIIVKIDSLKTVFSHGLPRLLSDKCKECKYQASDIYFPFRFSDLTPRITVIKDFRSDLSFSETSELPSK